MIDMRGVAWLHVWYSQTRLIILISESRKLSELRESGMCHDICERLDAKKDYRQVALHYGVKGYTIDSSFKAYEAGPSAALFEVLSAHHPDLTVREFINVLKDKHVKKDTIRQFEEFERRVEKSHVWSDV